MTFMQKMPGEKIMSNDDSTPLSYQAHVDYFYSVLDRCTYIMIEDENGDSTLITTTESLALLNWLQEQREHIEELQEQENTI
jgi:hypothetical protein